MGSVQYIDMRWKRRSLVIFLCPISWPVAVPLWDLKNSFRLQVFGQDFPPHWLSQDHCGGQAQGAKGCGPERQRVFRSSAVLLSAKGIY